MPHTKLDLQFSQIFFFLTKFSNQTKNYKHNQIVKKKSKIRKALKEKKIHEMYWKAEFMYQVKISHYFQRNSNLFHLIVSYFYYIYQEFSIRKYTLLVIDYVNFVTCLMTPRPTICIVILKVWSNNYVCKISPTYQFYIYLFFIYISRSKLSLAKILRSEEPNRT